MYYLSTEIMKRLAVFGAVVALLPNVACPAQADRKPSSKPQFLPNVQLGPVKDTENPVSSVILQPTRKWRWVTAAILLKNSRSTQEKAIGAAQYAWESKEIIRRSDWRGASIFVFTDKRAALAFKQLQTRRGGRPFTAADYAKNVALWRKTVGYYERRPGNATFTNPKRNPTNWWNSLNSEGVG